MIFLIRKAAFQHHCDFITTVMMLGNIAACLDMEKSGFPALLTQRDVRKTKGLADITPLQAVNIAASKFLNGLGKFLR